MLPPLSRGQRLQGSPQVTHFLSGKTSRMTQVQERHLKISSCSGFSLWKSTTSYPKGFKEERSFDGPKQGQGKAEGRLLAVILAAAIARKSQRQSKAKQVGAFCSEPVQAKANSPAPSPAPSPPFCWKSALNPRAPTPSSQVRPCLPGWAEFDSSK